MTFDFPTFCFEASLATLIALLAWGNQISQPRETVKEVENRFLLRFKEAKKNVIPILHNSVDSETGTMRYSLNKVTQSAMHLLKEKQLDESNVEILNKLVQLNKTKIKFQSNYNSRYFLTIALDVWFALAGSLSLANGTSSIINVSGYEFSYNELYAAIIAIIGLVILTNLVLTYFMELKFMDQAERIDEIIEVK
jgi:hypothetical protein